MGSGVCEIGKRSGISYEGPSQRGESMRKYDFNIMEGRFEFHGEEDLSKGQGT